MFLNGINDAFKAGLNIKLQNRGAASSGITWELKSIFNDLAQKGLIKDKDGKGLTKQDALNMYEALNKIHQERGLDTNYTKMQAGQEFSYSAQDLLAMAEAAGYKVSPDALPPQDEGRGAPEDETPVAPELKPTPLAPKPEIPEKLEVPKDVVQQGTENMIDSLGGKIIEREVNGQKQKIAVVDIDGQKVRRAINEDGSLGDTLVTVSTLGKNKYITQTEMDNRVAKVFPEGLPEGVTASYVSICGEPTMVFKKDGKTLDQAQLRELLAEQKAQSQEGAKPPISEGETIVAHDPVPAPVTGPAEGENPEYDAAVRGRSPVAQTKPPISEGETIVAHDPVPAPVTGPAEGENPAYDAAVRGRSPVAQTKLQGGAEKPEEKKYTDEGIQNNINNLKPGESFSYTSTISMNLGGGSYFERKPVTWKREEDGTLSKTTPELSQDTNSRGIRMNLTTRYSADGKSIISRDVPATSLKYAKELKATQHYDNGKPSVLTTDLTNVDNDLRPISIAGLRSMDSVARLLSSIEQQTRGTRPSKFATQEFKDSSGNSVVTFKDGQFFSAEGKKISYDKAHKILSKCQKNNQLASLVQTYKTEQNA